MRKPRTSKSALTLWLIDESDRVGLTPEQVAKRLGVSDSTVRGWEAGRSIGENSIRRLEEIFESTAPGRDALPGDQGSLVAALMALVEEMRLGREEQARWNRGVESALAELRGSRAPAEPTDDPAAQPREDAQPERPRTGHRTRGSKLPRPGESRPGWGEPRVPQSEQQRSS